MQSKTRINAHVKINTSIAGNVTKYINLHTQLCWDIMVTCPLADSYVTGAAREAGSAAELTAARKEDKYSSIDGRYLFEPIAIRDFRRVQHVGSQAPL